MKKGKTKLIIGRFYLVFNGPPHPSLVYKYDSKHKVYLSIKFGTSKGRHMTRIHPIQIGGNEQFVHNRPIEGTREDYGDKELAGLVVDARDIPIIEDIKNRQPLKTKRAKCRYK